jgi:hypothetical protein
MNTNRHEFFGTVLIFDRFASAAARDVILNEVPAAP